MVDMTKPPVYNGGKPPREIRNVSESYFSIARYYGGCKAFGANYVYIPPEDKLLREDLVKNYKKQHRRKKGGIKWNAIS